MRCHPRRGEGLVLCLLLMPFGFRNADGSISQSNSVGESGGVHRRLQSVPLTLKNDTDYDCNVIQPTGVLFNMSVTANLTISNVTFRNCGAGALYLSSNSSSTAVTLQGCSFINNSPTNNTSTTSPDTNTNNTYGGGLTLSGRIVVRLQSCTFRNNTASLGAAVYLSAGSDSDGVGSLEVVDCLFHGNRGQGGAVYVEGGVLVGVSGSNFTSNTGGSAMYLSKLAMPAGSSHQAVAQIMQSTFSDNSADGLSDSSSSSVSEWSRLGGALLIEKNFLPLAISDCTFEANKAARQGGAIAVSSGEAAVSLQSVTLSGNKAVLYGGALAASTVSTVTARDCEFRGNSATQGGAILVASMSTLELADCNLTANSASKFGGALSVTTSGGVIIADSTFLQNQATYAGAVECWGCAYVSANMSSFIFNSANGSAGALAVYSSNSPVTLQNNVFQGNRAGRNASSFTYKECSRSSFGAGGAVCASITVAMDLRNNTFDSNMATSGGALFVTRQCEIQADDTTCATARLNMYGDNYLYNNVADGGAGGAVYALNVSAIAITCDVNGTSTLYTGAELSSWPYASNGCNSTWSDNSAEAGGYGDGLATGLAGLRESTDNGSSLSNVNSNSALEVVLLMYDYLNTEITKGTYEATGTTVAAYIPADSNLSRYVSSGYSTISNDGVANLSSLQLRAPAGTYNLSFFALPTGVSDSTLYTWAKVSIQIRACALGEVTESSGEECTECSGPDYYGFDARNVSCDDCPSYATCNFNGSRGTINASSLVGYLVPDDGYWHSSPFSPQMHACPYTPACTYDDRAYTVGLFQELNLSASDTNVPIPNTSILNDITTYWQLQCAKGYVGRLCAQCMSPDYGWRSSGRCYQCPPRSLNVIFYCLSYLLTVVLLTWTVRATLGRSRTPEEKGTQGSAAASRHAGRQRSRGFGLGLGRGLDLDLDVGLDGDHAKSDEEDDGDDDDDDEGEEDGKGFDDRDDDGDDVTVVYGMNDRASASRDASVHRGSGSKRGMNSEGNGGGTGFTVGADYGRRSEGASRGSSDSLSRECGGGGGGGGGKRSGRIATGSSTGGGSVGSSNSSRKGGVLELAAAAALAQLEGEVASGRGGRGDDDCGDAADAYGIRHSRLSGGAGGAVVVDAKEGSIASLPPAVLPGVRPNGRGRFPRSVRTRESRLAHSGGGGGADGDGGGASGDEVRAIEGSEGGSDGEQAATARRHRLSRMSKGTPQDKVDGGGAAARLPSGVPIAEGLSVGGDESSYGSNRGSGGDFGGSGGAEISSDGTWCAGVRRRKAPTDGSDGRGRQDGGDSAAAGLTGGRNQDQDAAATVTTGTAEAASGMCTTNAGGAASSGPSLGTVAMLQQQQSGLTTQLKEDEMDREEKPPHTVVLKILINFLQVTSVARDLDLDFPSTIDKLWSVGSMASSAMTTLVSIDCSLPDNGISKALQRTVLYIAVPWIFILLALPVWLLLYGFHVRRHRRALPECSTNGRGLTDAVPVGKLGGGGGVAAEMELSQAATAQPRPLPSSSGVPLTGGGGGGLATAGVAESEAPVVAAAVVVARSGPTPFRSYMMTRMVVTMLTVVFYFYPTVIDSVLSIYQCETLDANTGAYAGHLRSVGYFWELDYGLYCFRGPHLALTLLVAVPGVVLWCVGVPLGSALWLRHNAVRGRLNEPQFSDRYGFLYEDYRRTSYYWESIIMARKLLVVGLLLATNSSEDIMQVLAVMGVVVIAAVLQLYFKPYEHARFNHLECVSLGSTVLILYLCCFFLLDGLTETAKQGVSVLILLVYIATVAWLLYRMVWEAWRFSMRVMDSDGDGRVSRRELRDWIAVSLGFPLARAVNLIVPPQGRRRRRRRRRGGGGGGGRAVARQDNEEASPVALGQPPPPMFKLSRPPPPPPPLPMQPEWLTTTATPSQLNLPPSPPPPTSPVQLQQPPPQPQPQWISGPLVAAQSARPPLGQHAQQPPPGSARAVAVQGAEPVYESYTAVTDMRVPQEVKAVSVSPAPALGGGAATAAAAAADGSGASACGTRRPSGTAFAEAQPPVPRRRSSSAASNHPLSGILAGPVGTAGADSGAGASERRADAESGERLGSTALARGGRDATAAAAAGAPTAAVATTAVAAAAVLDSPGRLPGSVLDASLEVEGHSVASVVGASPSTALGSAVMVAAEPRRGSQSSTGLRGDDGDSGAGGGGGGEVVVGGGPRSLASLEPRSNVGTQRSSAGGGSEVGGPTAAAAAAAGAGASSDASGRGQGK